METITSRGNTTAKSLYKEMDTILPSHHSSTQRELNDDHQAFNLVRQEPSLIGHTQVIEMSCG